MSERLYDYKCTECPLTFELWSKPEDMSHRNCPRCQKETLTRQFPSPTFKMPRESQHGFDGNGAKVKFGEAGRYNPKTGKIET